MQHTDHTPTTTLPCPDWCTLPVGHGFDSLAEDGNGNLSRFDSRSIGPENLTAGGVDGGRLETVSVSVEMLEVASPDESRVIRTDSIYLAVAGYRENTELDSTQARQLAAALLNAADEWDRITGA